MAISYYLTGLPITDGMIGSWGDKLERLNPSERLWLIRCGIGSMCDFEAASKNGLDSAISEAENALVLLDNQAFYLSVTYAFSQFLTENCKPLGYYLSSPNEAEQEWINNVRETWGDRLEDIPENDGLIFLFNISTELIDFSNLPNLEEMHEWLEAFKEIDDVDKCILLTAIGAITYDG